MSVVNENGKGKIKPIKISTNVLTTAGVYAHYEFEDGATFVSHGYKNIERLSGEGYAVVDGFDSDGNLVNIKTMNSTSLFTVEIPSNIVKLKFTDYRSFSYLIS